MPQQWHLFSFALRRFSLYEDSLRAEAVMFYYCNCSKVQGSKVQGSKVQGSKVQDKAISHLAVLALVAAGSS